MQATPALYSIEEIEQKGRGLVACRDIPKDVVIEHAHCILTPMNEYQEHLRFTVFENYLFKCKSGNLMLPLGVGCLFNHSRSPNVDYRVNEEEQRILYKTGRPIKKGEELTISYGGSLWFETGEDESSSDSECETLPFAGLDLEV
mmetsp:Transcript_2686/g.3842  ORF Transcript_2686/g.3842 Transcript_2686/m.3842 type:complete len:145 (+) Transcript_2686:216-650(+)